MKSNIDERTGKPKIILDLCGGTGSWSRPYREAGYDVRLVTLPDGDVRTYTPPANVYGILAAPPCTEFSLAKGGLPRDFEAGMETVVACMQIIWQCRKRDKLVFWALENPRGLLRQFLGRPHFTFEHWEFDPDAQMYKPTDLWGYFTEPRPTCTVRPKIVLQPSNNGRKQCAAYDNGLCPSEYNDLKLSRAAIRAITPRGFAEAFFKANR